MILILSLKQKQMDLRWDRRLEEIVEEKLLVMGLRSEMQDNFYKPS